MSAILGQLRIEKGSLGLDGTIAYVPQQAWIFHDTARENILFGCSWDKEKYDKGTVGRIFSEKHIPFHVYSSTNGLDLSLLLHAHCTVAPGLVNSTTKVVVQNSLNGC